MAAHAGELPNDSRYELIRAASVAISDQRFSDEEEAREALFDLSSDLVPCWTSSLLAWFSGNLSRLSDCDEAAEEGGLSRCLPISDLLSLGYAAAAREVLSILIGEIEENRSSVFDPDYDSQLVLSDSHGVFIPQLYCSSISEEDALLLGVSWEDVKRCQAGPDEEFYWESWATILDAALIVSPATLKEEESLWRLHQDGDLWEIRDGVELPDGF
jgi:hypothetical protein